MFAPEPSNIKKIVLLRPNHRLGNNLLLTPAIAELGRLYPTAKVDIVTSGRAGEAIFRAFPNVSDVLSFPRNSCHAPCSTLQIYGELRSRRYDLAIDPMPNSRSGRFLLNQIQATERIGYASDCRLRDHRLTGSLSRASAPISYAEVPVQLIRHCAEGPSSADSSPALLDLALTTSERVAGRRLLGVTDSPMPSLAVFANATGSKCYLPEWWQAALTEVRKAIPRLQIIEFIPDDGHPRLPSLAEPRFSRDLRIMGGALAAASLVVSGDCGIMHLADASQSRLLGLFKTTDLRVYGPRNGAARAMRATDADPYTASAMILDMLRATLRPTTRLSA
jgi:ADP-heptose:LPS heptosyltransferase